ncbi:hypothetical protein [Halalkalibacter akibai]|uniref:Uncharacterized protein n=1 Tax=Halalkalibacter akibai (strain ATCC 43226 / DSM 21942 / CIP 109018 / JCM 9157 / 1139) TaxID=1236973 RepID=W4R094_HALA3|nr:hypothetical protein [Halalkalibacter akibai]GAE36964.1 hypothetical protein JCM9157_4202 [Halalkalibacter akibai JCM 9157]
MLLEQEAEILVTKSIYLPLVRKVLERDMEKIKQADLKFHEPYLTIVERTIIRVGYDLGIVKRQLKNKRIFVYDQGIKEGRCTYLVVNRGYRHERSLFPHLVKQTVETYVTGYLNGSSFQGVPLEQI